MTSITVKNFQDAVEMANKFFPTDYELDKCASDRAGYNIYRSIKKDCNAWISDLGTRLELNFENGDTMNIWIETRKEEANYKESECTEYFSLSELLILNLAVLQFRGNTADSKLKDEASDISTKITKLAYNRAKRDIK